MQNEVYSDGIAEITVTGPIVRIDLMSLSPTERDAKGNPKPVLRQRIVMPVDGFANSVELMQKAVNGLIEAGAIKQTPIPSTDGARIHGNGDATARAGGGGNSSPNFSA
ncbi:hypothetical protein [Microvirga alba]|uniref:Uncharacterized protein n=1 Tax=Microvirga alba TaxID=2791025 RepID=A0A931BPX8_9HYPH|nr:hypothetical protein [Microvirga alba]MBF9233893.1 hypothetical protein [Microvirga alba]